MRKITSSQIKESYESVKQKSLFDFDYNFMLVISAAICFWGFRMNSPAVIIGAMVICPMLYSVIGIASSIFFGDFKQLKKELFSILFELFIVLAVVFLLGNIFMINTNNEITTRLATQNMDYFFVALLSGIAGCFAIYWPKIHDSLVGIAISVALIPPLVLWGIGLAQMDLGIMKSSLIIVLVNFLGIVLGSLLVLLSLKLFQRKDSK